MLLIQMRTMRRGGFECNVLNAAFDLAQAAPRSADAAQLARRRRLKREAQDLRGAADVDHCHRARLLRPTPAAARLDGSYQW